MKKFILSGFILVCICGLYFMNMKSSNPNGLVDQQILNAQNDCIDDLESSLYDFSTENALLSDEISFLREENEELKGKLIKFELKLGKLRKNVTRLELELNSAVSRLANLILENEASQSPSIVDTMTQENDENDLDSFQMIVEDAKLDVETKKEALKTAKEAVTKVSESILQIKDTKSLVSKEIESKEFQLQAPKTPTFQSENAEIKLRDQVKSKDLYFVESVDLNEKNADELLAEIHIEEEFSSKSPIYNLIENTSVSFEYISCRKDKYGKKIKKLSSSSSNWAYTFIQFNLDHETLKNILDKSFRIKILDIDKNEYVKFTHNKLIKPYMNYDFDYAGEAIQCAFYNDQKKGGQNFNLQVYLLDDGEEYLLEGSSMPIFTNGIVNENYTMKNDL